MTIEFEWDASKAKKNLGKHRISFEEATSAFYDALSITIAGPHHSVSESRYLLVGMTTAGRLKDGRDEDDVSCDPNEPHRDGSEGPPLRRPVERAVLQVN
jgi:hypothetical protein